MRLPPSPTADDWPADIAAEAIEEMTGEIWVLKPNGEAVTKYDPRADTGGKRTPTVILQARRARIQHTREPRDGAAPEDWTPKRTFRFQIELRPGDPILLSGMIVRVTNADRDPSLAEFAYTVTSAVNSSRAALRTIEAISEALPSPMPTVIAP